MGHTESTKADVLFERLYSDVDPRVAQSLLDFRSNNPPQLLVAGDIRWKYLSVGDGDSTLLFLHGMVGAYDIWWQQIEALRNRYRIISLTYPIVDNLEALHTGINSILHNLGIDHYNVVGTSLGGYLAQYLITRQPECIRCAVFANTYPPMTYLLAVLAAPRSCFGSLRTLLLDSAWASTLVAASIRLPIAPRSSKLIYSKAQGRCGASSSLLATAA